jgi:F-type H+-transporting ATPase subunit beta
MDLTDLDLLVAYREHGDRQALASLYERHAGAAFAVAFRLCGRQVEAEDAVQDGLLAVMADAHRYQVRPGAEVRSWVLALVANAARRRSRENRRRQHREQVHGLEVMGLPPAPAPDQVDGEHSLASELRALLDQLPDHERTPVLLRHADDLSIAEIATTLGRNEKTVRSQIDRGLAHLRVALVRRGHAAAPAAIPIALGEWARPQPSAHLLARLAHQAREAAAPLAATAATPLMTWAVIGLGLVMLATGGVAIAVLAPRHPDAPAIPPAVPAAGWASASAVAGHTNVAGASATPGPTDVPVGDGLLGRFLDGTGHALDDLPDPDGPFRPRGRPLTAAFAAPAGADRVAWVTGIKALDLFAPVVDGGRNALYAPAGLGRNVLVYELAERMHQRGGRTVMVGWDLKPGDGHGLMDDQHQVCTHLDPSTVVVWTPAPAADAEVTQAADAAATMAGAFHDDGHDVLVVLFQVDDGFPQALKRLSGIAGTAGGHRITLLVCHALGETAGGALPDEQDDRIVLAMGAEFDGAYPAIDPDRSLSRMVADPQLAAVHDLARTALLGLRHRAELIGGAAAAADQGQARALRLHAFLSQPFFTTVTFTGIPGASVTPAQTAAMVGRILAGDYDDRPAKDLRYIGAAPR